MRGRPIPYYADWLEIFGWDRASGEGTENIREAYEAISKGVAAMDPDIPADGQGTDIGGGTFPLPKDDAESVSDNGKDPASGSTSHSKGKKRKSAAPVETSFMELMHSIADGADARIRTLVKHTELRLHNDIAPAKVFDALNKFSSLSMPENVEFGQ